MLKFGFKTASTLLLTIIFLAVAAAILMTSAAFIGQIDWQLQIDIFGQRSGPSIDNQSFPVY